MEAGDSVRLNIRGMLNRALVGAMFAAALFFVEAGAGLLVLDKNAACREQADRLRFRFVTDEACLSDMESQFFETLLRGPLFSADDEAPLLLALGSTALMYGLLGGAAAQLSLKRGLLSFFLMHFLLLIVGTVLGVVALFST
jgi:hypothetical protein